MHTLRPTLTNIVTHYYFIIIIIIFNSIINIIMSKVTRLFMLITIMISTMVILVDVIL